MSDLERLREVFLTGVDEETKEENLAQIREWETALFEAEQYSSWKEHDVTRRIALQARRAYVDLSVRLATDRSMTDVTRHSFYARQDAMLWLLSLTDRDAKETVRQIESDIRRALEKIA